MDHIARDGDLSAADVRVVVASERVVVVSHRDLHELFLILVLMFALAGGWAWCWILCGWAGSEIVYRLWTNKWE